MVTVPAGTFWALRVEQDRSRYQEKYWYAPAVRWMIKRESSRNWKAEMVSFKLFPRPTQ
jgi:hypothetical protein